MVPTDRRQQTVGGLGADKVIRAADADLWLDAQATLEAAQRDALTTRSEALTKAQAEQERGYREGREAGEQEAAKMLANTVRRCELYLENRAEELVELVITATQSILHGYDDRERTRLMLWKAIKEHHGGPRLALRVHANELDRVREVVRAILDELGGPEIEVIADADLNNDACVLDTPLGYLQLGVDAQLMALRNGLLEAGRGRADDNA